MWELSEKQILNAVRSARAIVRFFNRSGRQPKTNDFHIHFYFSEILDVGRGVWCMYVFTGNCGAGRTIKKGKNRWEKT